MFSWHQFGFKHIFFITFHFSRLLRLFLLLSILFSHTILIVFELFVEQYYNIYGSNGFVSFFSLFFDMHTWNIGRRGIASSFDVIFQFTLCCAYRLYIWCAYANQLLSYLWFIVLFSLIIIIFYSTPKEKFRCFRLFSCTLRMCARVRVRAIDIRMFRENTHEKTKSLMCVDSSFRRYSVCLRWRLFLTYSVFVTW